MSAGGALAHRFAVRRVVAVGSIVFGAVLCALLEAWTGVAVAGGLIVSGFLGGVVDVTMNAEGARIERRLGKPILARLHAAASFGMAIGAILGSLIVASAGRGLPGLSPRSAWLRPASPMAAPPAAKARRSRLRQRRGRSASPSRPP